MNLRKKTLVYIFTGKRGGFSHFIPIMKIIDKKKDIDYKIIASDMHLSSLFGNTFNEIKLYTSKIIKLNGRMIKDAVKNRVSVISNNIENISKIFSKKKPDYLIVLGDRAEVLGAAIAAQFFNIPIVHMYGGDITQGGTDEPTRHAITKLSNLHLTSNINSQKNVRQMGEENWRINNVGLTSIDLFKNRFFKSKKYLEEKFSLDFKKPFIILIQHPVTWQVKDVEFQIKETLKAIKYLKIQTVAIYPCSDPGFKKIINAYNKIKNKDYFQLHKNIELNDFYSLLNYSKMLIGNSSCGITECGYLKKYVINIGIRQEGRVSKNNVFHIPHNSIKIANLITKILNKKKIRKRSFIYGDGKSAHKITKILTKKYDIKKLINKKFESLHLQ